MSKILAFTGLMVLWVSSGSARADQAANPFPCKYNDVDGAPTALYQRVESGPSDWYSRYKAIQFCSRSNGPSSYVLVEEELIQGFRVLNPPGTILSVTTNSAGVTSYSVAGFIDHIVLHISPDGKSMGASGTWANQKYHALLKLVWHK